VVSFVGIYDTLRHQLYPNGRYNEEEYGTVADAAQFRALYAYSPYHNVHPGTRYPAVLLETGENDPRVAPWQSRKFAAALQSATASPSPVLLLTRRAAGHGNIGASFSQRVGNAAAALIFFDNELR
jgi:prolyl oligopeptidase